MNGAGPYGRGVPLSDVQGRLGLHPAALDAGAASDPLDPIDTDSVPPDALA